jgi:hypothetical protein
MDEGLEVSLCLFQFTSYFPLFFLKFYSLDLTKLFVDFDYFLKLKNEVCFFGLNTIGVANSFFSFLKMPNAHHPFSMLHLWVLVLWLWHTIYTKFPNTFEHLKKEIHSNEHKFCNKLKLQNVTMQHKDQKHNHNEGEQVPYVIFPPKNVLIHSS